MNNRFIVADAEKCIGCRTCEVGCAMAHANLVNSFTDFHPRLKIIKGYHITSATVCHHCDNAPCIEACVPEAIVVKNHSVQVIQERCIGCKNCVIACPFGAIEVISTPQKSQALKCDLCEDIATSPTCVSVCPTGALSLMEAKDLALLVKNKKHRHSPAAW